jgi:hypothetical protein
MHGFVQTSLSSLSVAHLKRAVVIKEKIQSLEKQLAGILGGPKAGRGVPKRKRIISAAGRARIAAAQRARWAKLKRGKAAKAAKRTKKKMSASARARLSAIAKARWAKAKAAGKAKL